MISAVNLTRHLLHNIFLYMDEKNLKKYIGIQKSDDCSLLY